MNLISINNLTQPLKKTSKMVESAWVTMGHFINHLDQVV